MVGVRCDQRHVPGIAAQEQRLAHAMVAGADHADPPVGHFIAVADRAIAQQPARERCVVERVTQPGRAMIDHPGR